MQIWVVLVLMDHVWEAAEGGPSVLVDGVLHVGGGQLSLAGTPLHEDYPTFAVAWVGSL